MSCGIPPEVSRLAIVAPSWVGDTVMATPVYRAARRSRPNAVISVFLRPGLEEILHGLPWMDELIVCDMKGWLGPWRLARAIRRRDAQAVLLLPNSFRSALAARLSGALNRVGYDRDGRGGLLTHKLAVQKSQFPLPTIRSYARLAQFAFGLNEISLQPELFVTDEETAQAEDLLRDVDRPFAVINPGAIRREKRWPASSFAAVADALSTHHDLVILLTGSPQERPILTEVERAAKRPVINLAERRLNLGGLKAVIKRARLLITNDTGPRHIAVALGTPVITLFGPTDHRWTTLDNPQERLLVANPFLPEDQIADQHSRACAIERIAVGDVLAAAEQLLHSDQQESPSDQNPDIRSERP